MNKESGVSLIIIFFIMTIILVIVLSISAILFNEVKMVGSLKNSVSAFYAADTGIEKTLYFDRKMIPGGGTRGFCNICTACTSTTNDCNSCSFSGSDCGATTCTSCTLSYDSTFGSGTRKYTVKGNIGVSGLTIDSKGLYNGVTRQIELNGN